MPDTPLTISEEEYKVIKMIRELKPFDKLILAKNQNDTRITWTLVRQDQGTIDTKRM